MSDAILALNAGSSSIKFGVYDVEPTTGEPSAAARGTLNVGASSRLIVRAVDGTLLVERSFPEEGLAAAIRVLLDWIEREFGGRRVAACGHRIVHGATSFSDPVRLTPALVDAIDGLTPLAPLHQPRSVAPIRALLELRPDLPQIGCFDTAFHRTMGPPASRFALPRDYEARGIRRFGFHGLSYEYVAGRLRAEGKAGMKTVVAHLGNGASLCAMKDGRSLDTTMGFSALDGLVMGTRCGAIDPGVLLYLMQHGGMTPNDLEDLLLSTAEQNQAIGRRKSRPLGGAFGERREGVARPEFPARSVGALMGELWRFFVPGFGRGDSCRHSFRGC